jgi:hypothetical protein
MPRRRPKQRQLAHVRELLLGNRALVGHLAQQRREDEMLLRVRDLLPPTLRSHLLAAAQSDGVLTLNLDGPAWATRVRYLAPDLIEGLADTGIIGVKTRARPRGAKPTRQTPQRMPRLAPAVVDHLLAAADAMTEPAIGAIFKRLAERQRSKAPGARGD